MSGVNRLKVQKITESKLRGKALADALAAELNGTKVPNEPTKEHAKRKKK